MADFQPVGDSKRVEDPIEKATIDPVEQVDLNQNLQARYVHSPPPTPPELFSNIITGFATLSRASPATNS
jgi:hypothetical protein